MGLEKVKTRRRGAVCSGGLGTKSGQRKVSVGQQPGLDGKMPL